MQKHEVEQQTEIETVRAENFARAGEPRWRDAVFFEMAEAAAGFIIDNGGSEVSALNDW
jgi:hypothetical protein